MSAGAGAAGALAGALAGAAAGVVPGSLRGSDAATLAQARAACGAVEIGPLLGSASGLEAAGRALRGGGGGGGADGGLAGGGGGGVSASEAQSLGVSEDDVALVGMWGGVVSGVLAQADVVEVDELSLQQALQRNVGDGSLKPMCVGDVLELAAALNASPAPSRRDAGSSPEQQQFDQVLSGLMRESDLERAASLAAAAAPPPAASGGLSSSPLDRHARAHDVPSASARWAAAQQQRGWGGWLVDSLVQVLSPGSSPASGGARRRRPDRFVVLDALRERALRVVAQARAADSERFELAEAAGVLAVGGEGVLVLRASELRALYDEAFAAPTAGGPAALPMTLREREFTQVCRYLEGMGLAQRFQMKPSDGAAPVQCFKLLTEISPRMPVPAVTEADRGTLLLRMVVERLLAQQAQLSRAAAAAQAEAIRCRDAGQRSLGALHLRRRNNLLAVMEKRAQHEQQLRAVAASVASAQTNADVLTALRSGGEALRDIHTRHNLTAEAVDDVMLQVGEAMEDQNEVDMALSQGVAAGDAAAVDEDDVEAEYAELERQMAAAGVAMTTAGAAAAAAAAAAGTPGTSGAEGAATATATPVDEADLVAGMAAMSVAAAATDLEQLPTAPTDSPAATPVAADSQSAERVAELA